MYITIKKADKNTIYQAKDLSKKSRLIVKNGKVVELGIYRPIYIKNLKKVFVAINDKNRVVGAIKVSDFKQEDYEDFCASPDENPKLIGKICVDKNFRGNHIASQLIEFVKAQYQDSNLYAEVLLKPTENTPSLNAFKNQGFEIFREFVWYHKNFKATFTWGFLKYKNKKRKIGNENNKKHS